MSLNPLLSPFKKFDEFYKDYPKIIFSLTLLLLLLLAFTRRPELLTNAQFWAEDGNTFYKDAYRQGFFAPLFETYAGYIIFPLRLVASISLLFPLYLAPLIFNIAGLAALVAPAVFINTSRLRNIIPSQSAALLISIIYIALPNNAEVFGNLTNIQWHLGVLAFMVLVAKPTGNIWWRVFDFTALAALGLCSPLVVFLIPVAYLLWRGSKTLAAKFNLLLLIGSSILQALAVLFISHQERGAGHVQMDFLNFVKMLVGQIFMGGLLGDEFVDFYYQNHLILYVFFGLGTSMIVYAIIKGPLWLKLISLYWPFVLIGVFYSLVPVKEFNVWQGLTNPNGGQRYWFIPIVAWVATLLWLAFCAKNKFYKAVAITAFAFMLVIGIPHSWKIRPYTDLHFRQYADTFETIPKGQEFDFPINPGWQMTLVKH